jgi:hypothetical protein
LRTLRAVLLQGVSDTITQLRYNAKDLPGTGDLLIVIGQAKLRHYRREGFAIIHTSLKSIGLVNLGQSGLGCKSESEDEGEGTNGATARVGGTTQHGSLR